MTQENLFQKKYPLVLNSARFFICSSKCDKIKLIGENIIYYKNYRKEDLCQGQLLEKLKLKNI